MTDVLGHVHVVGRRRLRRRSRSDAGPRAGHDRDRRHRLRQAGAAARLDPATGSARRRRSCGRSRCGRTSRPSRSATGCCAAPRTSTARRANSVLAMGPSGVAGRLRAGRRVLRDARPAADRRRAARLRRGRAVPRPRLGAGEPRRRHGVPAGRRRRPSAASWRRDLPAATSCWSSGRLVTARIGDAGVRAWRRTPTTGSASAASRWRPARRREGLGLAVMAALRRVGRRAGGDHGVPPGARRQRPRPGALRAARLRRAPPLPLPRRAAVTRFPTAREEP